MPLLPGSQDCLLSAPCNESNHYAIVELQFTTDAGERKVKKTLPSVYELTLYQPVTNQCNK